MAGNRPVRNIYIINDNGVYDSQILQNISSILQVNVRELQNANIHVTKHTQIQGEQPQFQNIHHDTQGVSDETRKQKEKERREMINTKYNFLQERAKQSWKEVFNPSRRSVEGMYFKTKAYMKVRTTIIHYNSVVIMGCPSTGKTATALFLADEFKGKTTLKSDSKYKILKPKSPQEFKDHVDPNQFMVIIIDDIFGKHSVNLRKVELWHDFIYEMQIIAHTANGKLKLIITCDSVIYKSACQFLKNNHLFSESKIVDITDDMNSLNVSERRDLLRAASGFISSNDTVNVSGYDHIGFPLSCRLFGIFKMFQNLGRLFFEDPAKYLKQEISKVKSFDKTLYGILVYAALNNGKLDVRGKEVTELDPTQYENMKKVLQDVGADLEFLEMWVIQQAAEMLNGVFLIPLEKYHYRILHHRLTEYILEDFEMLHSDLTVELMSPELFEELIKIFTYKSIYENPYKTCILLSHSVNSLLAKRMVFQILQGNIRESCQHQIFTEITFVKSFFEYLDQMGNIEAVYRARDNDHLSLLFWAAWYGRDLLVEGFSKNESLIRMVDDGLGIGEQRVLALMAASYRGGIIEYEPKKISYQASEQPSKVSAVQALLALNPQINCSPEVEVPEKLFNFEFAWMLKNKAKLLHYAVAGGSIDTVNAILEHKPDINAKTAIGETVMHFVTTHSNPAIAKILIDHGADIGVKSNAGKTPLTEAVVYGSTKIAKLLIEKGGDVNSLADDDRPLLHIAVANCNYDIMELLVENGVDINAKLRSGWTALHSALFLGDTKAADFLIEKGATVTVPGYGAISPLHEAVSTYDMDILDILLEAGVSVNITNMEGQTPLHLAAKNGNLEMIKKLLDFNADPNKSDSNGKIPLNYAASAGNTEVMEYLMIRSERTGQPTVGMFMKNRFNDF